MVIGIILVAICLPESPKWLYGKGKYDEVKEVLLYVAKMNGRKNFKEVQRKMELLEA